MKATDISPLFTGDGVYRLEVNPTIVRNAPREAILATLVVVMSGDAYAVHLEPIGEPEHMAQLIRDEAAAIVRMVDET